MNIGDYITVYWDCEKEDSSESEVVSIDGAGNPIIKDDDDQVYSTEVEDGDVFVIPNYVRN